MARTISMASDAWTTMGLDGHLDPEAAEFRNETDSGHGDDEGEWFATECNVKLADGLTYHVLFHGTHGNDHSPFTSFNSWATIYRADCSAESAEFKAEADRWEAMPERLDDDSEDDDLVPDCEPHGVEVSSIDTLDDNEEEDIPTPDGWDAIDTSTEDSESRDS